MAAGAQQIALGPIPVAYTAAMDSLPPIPENRAVALPTQAITFVKTNQRPVCETKPVPIIRIVAVKTPSLFRPMIKHDVVVHILENAAFNIRLHIRMTLRTGKDVFRKWRRRHSESLGSTIEPCGVELSDRRIIPLNLRKIFRRKRLEPPALVALEVGATLDDRQDGHQSDPGKENQHDDQRRGLGKNIPVIRIHPRFVTFLNLIRNNQPPSSSHQHPQYHCMNA